MRREPRAESRACIEYLTSLFAKTTAACVKATAHTTFLRSASLLSRLWYRHALARSQHTSPPKIRRPPS